MAHWLTHRQAACVPMSPSASNNAWADTKASSTSRSRALRISRLHRSWVLIGCGSFDQLSISYQPAGRTLVDRLPSAPGSLGSAHVTTAQCRNRSGAGDRITRVNSAMAACLRSEWVENFATSARQCAGASALCSRCHLSFHNQLFHPLRTPKHAALRAIHLNAGCSRQPS